MAQLTLTFDDGPDPVWTPRLLERLDALDVRATFFVLGERVERAPEQLEAMLAAGHTVGLHGDRHLDHSRTAPDLIRHDTETALGTLAAHGVTPTSWRLPWGRRGPGTDDLAADHRLRVVPWDHDTHDWRGDGWADQPDDTEHRLARGGIVLMHDAVGPGATRVGCVNTLELVDEIVRTARAVGVPIGPIDEPGGIHG